MYGLLFFPLFVCLLMDKYFRQEEKALIRSILVGWPCIQTYTEGHMEESFVKFYLGVSLDVGARHMYKLLKSKGAIAGSERSIERVCEVQAYSTLIKYNLLGTSFLFQKFLKKHRTLDRSTEDTVKYLETAIESFLNTSLNGVFISEYFTLKHVSGMAYNKMMDLRRDSHARGSHSRARGSHSYTRGSNSARRSNTRSRHTVEAAM